MALEEAVRKLGRIERDTALLLVVSALLCGVLTGSWQAGLSLTAGGILMLANFHFLWRFSKGVVESTEQNRRRLLLGLSFLFLLFLGAAGVVLIYFKAPILPFFAGTLCLVAAIFVRGVFFS